MQSISGLEKYQTRGTVFYRFSKHREESWKYDAQWSSFTNLEVWSHCLECLTYLLNWK